MTNYILQQNMAAVEANQKLSMTAQLNTHVTQIEQIFGYKLNFFLAATKQNKSYSRSILWVLMLSIPVSCAQFGHIILVWSQFGNIFNHGHSIFDRTIVMGFFSFILHFHLKFLVCWIIICSRAIMFQFFIILPKISSGWRFGFKTWKDPTKLIEWHKLDEKLNPR